jgi:hypothetical protein
MPMPDRIGIARDVLAALGIAPDDLLPSQPDAVPSTPAGPVEVIAALIAQARHYVTGGNILNLIGKEEALAAPLPFTAKQIKRLAAWIEDLASVLRRLERERKAGEPKPTKSEPPEIIARRDALRRCLAGGQTQVHVARATDIASSQLNAFLASRVRLGPASAARLDAYLATQ